MARSLPTLIAFLLALPAALSGQDPVVTSSLPAEGFVDRDTPIEIRLDRPLARDESVALWIGSQDVTGLARRTADGLSYRPDALPLPGGERAVTVFLVSEGAWREIGSFPLRVRGSLGFESSEWEPRLSLGMDGRVAEGHAPEDNAPARETYQDVEGELSLETAHVHRSFTLSGSAKVFGTSYREKALRFGQDREDAPRVDLAEYTVTAERGDASLTFGHLRTGDHRHLLQGHGSRGAQLSLRAGDRVEMSAGLSGATRMVGWDRPLGIANPDERLWNASLGLEALETPGALRFDVTLMGGSKLPRSGFNRGAVVDAETSDGVGVRMRANALDRRLTLDAGIARSTFDNPDDPALSGDTALVEVREEEGMARYLDASLALLRGMAVGSRTAGLSLGLRHERVDPLYRSVGARVRADNLSNEVDLQADVGGVSLRASVGWDEDNLDEVASILKSHTDRTGVTLGLPMARVVGSRSSWLPRIQLRLDRTHQFGEALPEDGGFSPSHVPDQVSDRRSARVDWRFSRVTLGYRWDGSHQDNRQEGREDADLEGSQHAWSLGLTPFRSLTLGLDLGLERAENLERDELDRTLSTGGRVEWRPLQRSTVSLRWSRTATEDRAETRERIQSTFDAQLTSAIPGASRVDGQLFLRFSRRDAERSDAVLELVDRRESWTVTTGLTLTLQKR